MKDLLGWILAAAGVYIIYEKYVAPSTGSTTTVTPGTTSTQINTGDQTTVSSNTTNPSVLTVSPYSGNYTDAQIKTIQDFGTYASQNNLAGSMLNVDQWNWYLNAATGMTGPAPETMGVSPRNALMSYGSYSNFISRWMNGITSLNGIPGLTGGMGRLVPANYSGQYPSARDYRSMSGNRPSAIPTGWELTNKKVN